MCVREGERVRASEKETGERERGRKRGDRKREEIEIESASEISSLEERERKRSHIDREQARDIESTYRAGQCFHGGLVDDVVLFKTWS